MKPPVSICKQTSVLVTRPAHQAQLLLQKITALGLTAISFPTIEIKAAEPSIELKQQMAALAEYKKLIFISANAVNFGLDLLEAYNLTIETPVLAIGKATAQALLERDLKPINLASEYIDSETLLNDKSLQAKEIKQSKIMIFRGQAGREHLAQTLRERGAKVDYIQAYSRHKAKQDTAELIAFLQREEAKLVTVASNESLQNLYDMLTNVEQKWLLKTALIVPSERCKILAQQLGFKSDIILAKSANDESVLDAIKDWTIG